MVKEEKENILTEECKDEKKEAKKKKKMMDDDIEDNPDYLRESPRPPHAKSECVSTVSTQVKYIFLQYNHFVTVPTTLL